MRITSNENNFYSLQSQSEFQILIINTTLKAIESIRYLVLKILAHLKKKTVHVDHAKLM